jgi:hypothetical protein
MDKKLNQRTTKTSLEHGAEIRIAQYPQLQAICWNMAPDACVTPAEALSLYERNVTYVRRGDMQVHEAALLEHLIQTEGKGVFHV